MSEMSDQAVELLNTIAGIQTDISEGKPACPLYGSGNSDPERTPFDIQTEYDRKDANEAAPGLVDQTLGDAMTASDEGAIVATWERAVQGSAQSRIRRMAHVVGRAKGQGDTEGILRYGLHELLVRPE